MPSKPKDKEPRIRTERVASLIQELLGPAIREYTLETNSLATVSRVEVTPDMRTAKVWLSIFGGQDELVLAELKKHIYHIQGALNRELTMKIIPRLEFVLDTSPRQAQAIAELIDKIHQDR